MAAGMQYGRACLLIGAIFGASAVLPTQAKANKANFESAEVLTAPGPEDEAGDVAGPIRLFTLEAIESARLTRAKLPEAPWSDDYWPIYSGIIAKRYSDPNYPDSPNWKANADYALKGLRSSSVETLSPAEKYDLLIGDQANTLTRVLWAEGESYFKRFGKVEPWMGICEGWAAASFMIPRPTHKIEVVAADGRTSIPFYPSDIKALASLLWSRAPGVTRNAGLRCNDKDPAAENGRPKDTDCFDSNPATLHVALVNQIGIHKSGLVMDANFDYEVWNFPISGYQYWYFNPATGNQVRSLSEAKVALSDFRNDPYRGHRAPAAVAIVGVLMRVSYMLETSPRQTDRDGPEHDRYSYADYRYDLELDAKGQIIGGEWYQVAHPDFLWAVAPGSKAKSIADIYLDHRGDRSEWNGKDPLPAAWRSVAPRAAASSQPLARIVDALVTLSRLGI